MGQLNVAFDERLGREVLLKELRPDQANRPDAIKRFQVEAQVLGALEHASIVPIYDVDELPDGRPFFAMRLLQGALLSTIIRVRHGASNEILNDGGTLPADRHRLLRHFHRICLAMQYAHNRGVLHRDLSPNNIYIGHYEESFVIDWGLAASFRIDGQARTVEIPPDEPEGLTASTLMTANMSVGTPSYMSPEQILGDLSKLGPTTDIYALGASLYCLLTGRPPFDGRSAIEIMSQAMKGKVRPPRELDPEIPSELEAVCLRAMAHRPEDRYPSCQDLANDLEHWLTGTEPASTGSPSLTSQRPSRFQWFRRYGKGDRQPER